MAKKKAPVRPQPPRARPPANNRKAAARSAKKVKIVAPKKTPKTKKSIQKATSSIIESNRKTELCRNWMKGTCEFGARCAFAHGVDDIKHKTLRQLEREGRIPDASKHHCSLCMIWVTTGACPKGKGCVFIHDPRATGPVEATLRPPPNLHKINSSSSTSKTGSSKLLCADGGVVGCGDALSFPDIPRDPDSIELPADKELYDLDLNHAAYAAGRNLSAVYKLWYSFLSTMIELNVVAITGDPIPAATTDHTATGFSGAATPTSTIPGLEPPPSRSTASRVSYKDAATRSFAASRRSSAANKTADTAASSAKGAKARVAKKGRASSTATGTAATAATAAYRHATHPAAAAAPAAGATAAVSSPAAAGSRLELVEGLMEMEIPLPKDSVKHLPVFESLCKGRTLAPPGTLPLPDTPPALGRDDDGTAAASGEEDGAPSPAPSPSSVYYSPTSSPTVVAAPPSPAGGTTAVAAAGVGAVELEGDSYFSCPSSPARPTATMLKPPPGFEAADPFTDTGAWSSSSTDVASWTSSASSSEDGDNGEDSMFDFLQHYLDDLPNDSRTPAAVAGEGRVSATTGRLPFFAGLQRECPNGITSAGITSDDPRAGVGTNGSGDMFYLLLHGDGSGGGGGGGGFTHGDHMTALQSRSTNPNEYGNGNSGGGFVGLDGPASTAFVPLETVYGHPVARVDQHRQPLYTGAAGHNMRNIYGTHFF